MTSKLPKISKELLITGLIIFAAFCFRSVFSLTQTSHFVATNIIYMLIAFVPLTILIASGLSENFKNKLKVPDILAIVVVMYALVFVLHDTVIRYYILTAIGAVSLSLLLCKSIYTLPVAAILNLITVFVPQLDASAVMSIPAAICFSTVSFSYIFEKQKAVSKKKSAKPENSVPATNYKKEKIIFAISEIILFAALALMVYNRRYTMALISLRSNLKYFVPILIPAILFVIFAVYTLKNKKPFVGVIGYLVAVATIPFTQLCEYSFAAGGAFTAFVLLFALCDSKLDSGKLVEDVYGKISGKISKKTET